MIPRIIKNVSCVALAAFGFAMVTANGCPSNVTNSLPSTEVPTSEVPNVTPRPPGIYVTNQDNKIRVFSLDARGDVAPIRTIGGANTQLNLPLGMGMDSKANLYVANRKNGLVTVFPGDANGDVAPTRSLTDPDMGSPSGVAIGPDDAVYVSTCPGCGSANGGQVGVFHFNNNSSVSDYRIGGATNANTGFTFPSNVALDNSNPALGVGVVVGNSFGGKIEYFGPGIQGDQFPTRTLSPRSGANLQGMFFGGNALFLSIPGAVVDIYPANATPNAPPTSTLTSSPQLPIVYPAGIFVDVGVSPPVGYLADYNGNTIYIIETVGTPPNLTIGSVTSISGAATGLKNPLSVLVVKS